ncbi:ParB family protein [Ottowia sp. oral taxon 894]|uniref:ParB family protein n=1 Tax=Ottowia sp. oral taxon 894 TaxID=1658672 RepID=UPI000680FE28|nr:ParB family protein [Ottowia sp. oral taxon 894]
MSSRTPETLTAAQRAQRLNLHASSTAEAGTNPMSKQQQRAEAQARRSLLALGQPGGQRNATADIDPGTDADMSFAVLPIDQIEPYQHNPRTGTNPRYDEIKASIMADGITNMLTVTRRSQHDKYTTYGGGNTRLRIAKELHAAGDQRFATLQVVVKQWPGDAQVITAHLVENENRGDITFWEKAQGIQKFKAEYEKESGKPLTAGELNKELKQRGLSYSVRVLQNFAFSVEHLTPVGPWLMATEVNAVIRPAVSGLMELATKFSQSAQFQARMRDVLERHRLDMVREAERLDPSEQAMPELDIPKLIDDLQETLASLLGVDQARVQAMVHAIASQPRLTTQQLLSVPAVEAMPADAGALAGRPATTLAKAPAGMPVTHRPEQPPLGAMLVAVPPKPSTAGRKQQGTEAAASSAASLLEAIRNLLGELNAVVPLHDVLLASESLPFGYMTDLPVDITAVDGAPVQQPALRAALWKVLTALSGQCDQRFSEALTPETKAGIDWCGTVEQGAEAFAMECAARVRTQTASDGMPLMGLHELSVVLSDPQVGDTIVLLLTKMEQMRLHHPQRMRDGHVPLFAPRRHDQE